MAISSANSAPGTQTMSRSDERHAASMAHYAQSKSLFDASPSRQCAANLGYCALLSGCLGLGVVTPVVASTVSTGLAIGITAGASAFSCVLAPFCLEAADVPCAPTDPDFEITQLG